MTAQKTSLLVNKQLPEFIREEYPKFISFLEAYYEFLETKQNNQKNDLINATKEIRYNMDVDVSLDQFETEFYNTFLSYIPRDAKLSKQFLVKNILPLYRAKGTEKSFQLLYRMLFSEDIEIKYPREYILKASDGKWFVENVIRVSNVVYNRYVGDGVKKEFNILPCRCPITGLPLPSEVDVYINNVQLGDGYAVKKDFLKIVFDVAPAENDEILIYYENFDVTILRNRKIIGGRSGASAITENVVGLAEAPFDSYEISLDPKTIRGSFQNSEEVYTTVFINDELVNVYAVTEANLKTINVIDGGANYNIGDPVFVVGGAPKRKGFAVVEDVITGFIENIIVLDGGAGFEQFNNIVMNEYDDTLFDAFIDFVDTDARNTTNLITISTNTVNSLSDIVVDSVTFLNNTIYSQMYTKSIDVGPILSIDVVNSYVRVESTTVFDTLSSQVANTKTFDSANGKIIRVFDLGLIGKISINQSGNNYNVGETLTFTNLPGSYSGHGANAIISHVNPTGGITGVKIVDPGIGYKKGQFPTITINSAYGANANLSVYCLMGDGERLLAEENANVVLGQILKIKVLDPGQLYTQVPTIDLSQRGDGTAIAEAILNDAYYKYPGRWTTSQGILSSSEMRIQGGEYYIDYSYVLNSQIEFKTYKTILKKFIHPAGTKLIVEYDLPERILNVKANVYFETPRKVYQFVTIQTSNNYVTGTNTKFLTLNLQRGSHILIGENIRYVNTLVSNTELIVTQPFTQNLTAEEMILLNKKVPDLQTVSVHQFSSNNYIMPSYKSDSPVLISNMFITSDVPPLPGDLLVVFDTVYGQPDPKPFVANGWTVISNTVVTSVATKKTMRSIISYKILRESDFDSRFEYISKFYNFFRGRKRTSSYRNVIELKNPIQTMGYDNLTTYDSKKIAIIYRPSSPISNVEIQNLNAQGIVGVPSIQRVNTSNAGATVLALAHYRSNSQIETRVSTNLTSAIEVFGVPLYGSDTTQTHFVKSQIYNIGTNGSNGIISMANSSNVSILQSFYLKVI